MFHLLEQGLAIDPPFSSVVAPWLPAINLVGSISFVILILLVFFLKKDDGVAAAHDGGSLNDF